MSGRFTIAKVIFISKSNTWITQHPNLVDQEPLNGWLLVTMSTGHVNRVYEEPLKHLQLAIWTLDPLEG